MKKILLVLTVAVVGLLGAMAWSLAPETLPVPADFAMSVPATTPPAGVSVQVLHTGKMKSQAAFAYRGGALGEERIFGMAAMLVRHPQGLLLIDAGFGRNAEQHFLGVPPLMRATSKMERETAAADQLQAAGIELTTLTGVLITHAHWDHVSGLEDLRGVPVLVPQTERDFIASGHRMAHLAASFGELNYRTYAFADGPYLGFETSHDVFKDGSVVVVPAPGHTPGSVIVFVATPGKRYAFIGDLAWQREGIEIPAQKPWLSRRLVDLDAAQVRRWIVHMHQLQKAIPGLIIVPAHDRRVHETLPRLGS